MGALLRGRNYIRDSFGAADEGNHREGSSPGGHSQDCWKLQVGMWDGRVQKLACECLGKSHEVMLDRKIHPSSCLAAVTLVPLS